MALVSRKEPRIYNGLFADPAMEDKLAFDKGDARLKIFYDEYLRAIREQYYTCMDVLSWLYVLRKGVPPIIFTATSGFLLSKLSAEKIDAAKQILASEDFTGSKVAAAMQTASIALTSLLGTKVMAAVLLPEVLAKLLKAGGAAVSGWYLKNKITDIREMQTRAGFFVEPFGKDEKLVEKAFKNLAEEFTFRYTAFIQKLNNEEEIRRFARFLIRTANDSLMSGHFKGCLPSSSILIQASVPEKNKGVYKKTKLLFFSSDRTATLDDGRNVPYSSILKDSPVVYYDPQENCKPTRMEKRQVGFIRNDLPNQSMVLRCEVREMGYHLPPRSALKSKL